MIGTLLLSSFAGSRLYGTHREDSDIDRRNVFILNERELNLLGLREPQMFYKLEHEDTTYTELGNYLAELLKGSTQTTEYTMNPTIESNFEPRVQFYNWFWSKALMRKQMAIGYALCREARNQKSWSNGIRTLFTLRRFTNTGVYNPVLSANEVKEVQSIRSGDLPFEEVTGLRLRLGRDIGDWLEHNELQEEPKVSEVENYLLRERARYRAL